MESLLFHILSGADLDWLFAVANLQNLEPNQIIDQSHDATPCFHLTLSGQAAIAMPHQHPENLKELIPLITNALIGAVPGLENGISTAVLQAKTACQLLSIDLAQLMAKMSQDKAFAAHFYQFVAMAIMQCLGALIQQFQLNPTVLYQINVKEASHLFAELQDSHLDWLIAVGQRQQLPAEQILQRVYRPIEALHIVLDGALSVDATTHSTPISPPSQDSIQEIARLGRGDLFGELRSLQDNARSLPMHIVQVQTLRETEILSIPHWRIAAKLLHDTDFALHYYRTLAQLMAGKYHTILTKLGFLPSQQNQAGTSDRLLAKVAKVEANFEWMEQRIQSKVVIGREIVWSLK